MKAKYHSEKSKRKMSEARKGKPAWNKGQKTDKPSWMKGKKLSEVMTPEKYKIFIEKNRKQILQRYAKGDFPKQTNTKPERQVKEELLKRGYKEGINFIHQYKFMNKFMCDFCFPQQKLIIEVDGDFWHCNPKKYPTGSILHPHQIKGIGRDKSKSAYIMKVDNGAWTLFRFWESDIKKDVAKCVDRIEEFLREKK
jgi:very-short-patch-repair endonuclease